MSGRTQTGTVGRASSFTLVAPPGWYRLDLDPDTSSESIRRLVAGRVSVPALQDELTSALEWFVAAARRMGAVFCAQFADLLGGALVRASLIVSLVPADERVTTDDGVDVAALREVLVAPGRDVPAIESELVELSAGVAVRTRTRPAIPVADRDVEADNVQYHVPVPGTTDILVVTFSTPTGELTDDLIATFDAIAATIEWGWA